MGLLYSQRGQSLIQVLISVGIMGVVLAVMSSMHSVQNRENTALMEKVISIETMRLLSQTAGDASACAAIFTTPGNVLSPSPATFDEAAVSVASPLTMNVKMVPGIGSAGPVATVAQVVSAVAPTMVVAANGIRVKVNSPTSADLVVTFDPGKLVRPIHELAVRLNLQTTGPSNAKQIIGCYGGNNGPLQKFTAADFALLSPTVLKDDPDYHAYEYYVPLPTRSYAQRLVLTTTGIWDIHACGTCSAAVHVSAIINGGNYFCGQNSSYGVSSNYDGYPDITVTCMVDVPANATVRIDMIFDGRGGEFPHYSPSYATGGASGGTPVLSVLSIPNG